MTPLHRSLSILLHLAREYTDDGDPLHMVAGLHCELTVRSSVGVVDRHRMIVSARTRMDSGILAPFLQFGQKPLVRSLLLGRAQ
jgi:hypothetical protein